MKLWGKQKLWRNALPVISAAMLTLCSGCAGRQSALDPAGPQSLRLSRMWWLMFWVCTVVFILVMAALCEALRRARSRARPEVEPIAERKITKVIAGALGISAVILFILMIADFMTGRAVYSQPQNALQIKVYGRQWWWEFQYGDPQPSRRVTTANEIHIPVGRPVMLQMTARDVIHSLWVPNLHGKTDLMPGYQTTMWLQADRPGTYRGQCAEYCGHQHAHMAFLVVAESNEQFNAWFENQCRAAHSPIDASQQRGQQLFMTRGCVMCHQIRGTNAGGRLAPDLTHLASRQTIAAGTLQNNRDNLGNWIADSQHVKPGNRMPPSDLNGEDLQAIVSYLENLK